MNPYNLPPDILDEINSMKKRISILESGAGQPTFVSASTVEPWSVSVETFGEYDPDLSLEVFCKNKLLIIYAISTMESLFTDDIYPTDFMVSLSVSGATNASAGYLQWNPTFASGLTGKIDWSLPFTGIQVIEDLNPGMHTVGVQYLFDGPSAINITGTRSLIAIPG